MSLQICAIGVLNQSVPQPVAGQALPGWLAEGAEQTSREPEATVHCCSSFGPRHWVLESLQQQHQQAHMPKQPKTAGPGQALAQLPTVDFGRVRSCHKSFPCDKRACVPIVP